jgi:hypothetical protein
VRPAENSPSMGRRGRRFSEAWALLFAGVAILVAVAVDVGYFAVGPAGAARATAASAHYPRPAVSGVLQLHDPVYGMSAVSPVGGPCRGMGEYDGILGGTPVVVRDASGGVITSGALDIGRVAEGATCEFAFVVQLPKAEVYKFEIANRPAGTYSYDDLVARGWDLTLSLD